MKSLFASIFLIMSLSSFGQQYLDLVKEIKGEQVYTLNIDKVQETIISTHRNQSNLIVVHGFYFDTNKMHQKAFYECLPNYNPDKYLFHFQIYKGNYNSLPLSIVQNGLIETTDVKHSSLYIFCRSEDSISNYLQDNQQNLSISFQEAYKGIDIYKLENISSQEEYCFRLNQIYYQTDKRLGNIEVEESLEKPVVNFFSTSFESSFGIVSSGKSIDNDFFSAKQSVYSQWFEVGINTRLNLRKLFIDLEVNKATLNLKTSIEDTEYTYPVLEDFLNERSVITKGVEEGSFLQLNSIGLGVGYMSQKKGNFSLSLSLNAKTYFSSKVSSELQSGSISYRGNSQSIEEQLQDVEELLLFEDVDYLQFASVENKVNGFSLHPKFSLNYSLLNFTFKAGLAYQFNYLKLRDTSDSKFISTTKNHYSSTFEINEVLNNSFLSCSFGVSYSFK